MDVNNPATLDELVAMAVDAIQAKWINGEEAVADLRAATDLCPVICAGLLVRESIRRDLGGAR